MLRDSKAMTLEEIKQAVRSGKTVCAGTDAYEVRMHKFRSGEEQWLVCCTFNKYCYGLTWQDGKTMNDKEESFYIKNP